MGALFGVLELGLRFLEAVEGGGGEGVGGLVRVDEEGEFAVLDFDLGVRDARLEIEDGVGVEFEGFEDAVNFGILEWAISF